MRCGRLRQLNLGPNVGDTVKVQLDVYSPGRRAVHAWLVGGSPTTDVQITQEQGGGAAPVVVWSGVGVGHLVSSGFPLASQTAAVIVQNNAGPGPVSLIVEYEYTGGRCE